MRKLSDDQEMRGLEQSEGLTLLPGRVSHSSSGLMYGLSSRSQAAVEATTHDLQALVYAWSVLTNRRCSVRL